MCKQQVFLKPTTFGDKLKNSLLAEKTLESCVFLQVACFMRFQKSLDLLVFVAVLFFESRKNTRKTSENGRSVFGSREKLPGKQQIFKTEQH